MYEIEKKSTVLREAARYETHSLDWTKHVHPYLVQAKDNRKYS
jgi:hypothetical protein